MFKIFFKIFCKCGCINEFGGWDVFNCIVLIEVFIFIVCVIDWIKL